MFKRLARAFGKTDAKVVAVFAAEASHAEIAVRHVQKGAVPFPIYVYSLRSPTAWTAAACARVVVERGAWKLALRAHRELWPFWIALGIAPWTGRGSWLLKILPFSFPPFRALLMNEHGDFFAGTLAGAGQHLRRRFLDRWETMRARETVRAARAWWFLGMWLGRVGQRVRGLCALPFALVAQKYSPLSRAVFSTMRGTAKLELPETEPASSGSAIDVICYSGREWHAEKWEKRVRESRSRWLLFTPAEKPSVEDMLPLFADARTFAVSRQNGFRGWQKLLFATAPFRLLQSGEASAVLAPVAREILVDRAKLEALGLPELSAFGSSWYVLFWKAASAGWVSYSIGGNLPQTELPAVPFYEAQFVHALLLDPALARLKPSGAGLSRGNIAQRAAGGECFRGLPRVLVLSPYLPYPLTHGGAVRIFHLCQALARRVDFVLVCFREKGDAVDYASLHQVFREVYVLDIDERPRRTARPSQVDGYESSSLRALIPALCAARGIDLLQVEYTQMAAYRQAAPGVPAILVEHDITFSLHKQFAELEKTAQARGEYLRWLTFERERLRAFDTVWTMSEHDRVQAIAAGSAPETTVNVPNGVDLRRFAASGETGAPREILYVGSFRHRPNLLGFEELRQRVMPAVWEKFPDATLVVVAGPGYEKFWSASNAIDPRILVHGYVADVAPFYRSCGMVVIPLPISAGTNIKLMEALAAERAVVTTPVGCVGLGLRDGEDALVRELGPAFGEAVCALLEDPEKRFSIARQGRRAAEDRFSWESIAVRAMESYERMLTRRPDRALHA